MPTHVVGRLDFLARRIVQLACWSLAAGSWPSAVDAQQPPSAVPPQYVTTARQETLLASDLVSVPGKVGTVLRVELPKGWVGDWHYHTGDVFVYVVSGRFVVDVEREGRKEFGPGQVYHEAVDTTMRARNPSASDPTSLILFQVGGQGEPLMRLAKPPGP